MTRPKPVNGTVLSARAVGGVTALRSRVRQGERRKQTAYRARRRAVDRRELE